LIGVHGLFIVGYALTLLLTLILVLGMGVSPAGLWHWLGVYGFLVVLPVFGLAFVSWLVTRLTPDELTRATKASELGRKDLQNRLESFCVNLGWPLFTLYIVDHEAYNAMYWENGDDRRLYVTRGLVDGVTPDELDCVMAQQLGRRANGDIFIYPMMSLFITTGYQLTSGAFIYSILGGIKLLPDILSMIGRQPGMVVIYGIIPIFGILWWAFRVYGQRFGWSRERSADLFAIRLTKNARGLVSAINKTKNHYFFPIVTEELRGMLFINPDPGLNFPWYEDEDERIVHLRDDLGAGAFSAG
jgi:Zn-dependent protease with chaperone function